MKYDKSFLLPKGYPVFLSNTHSFKIVKGYKIIITFNSYLFFFFLVLHTFIINTAAASTLVPHKGSSNNIYTTYSSGSYVKMSHIS